MVNNNMFNVTITIIMIILYELLTKLTSFLSVFIVSDKYNKQQFSGSQL